MEWMRVNQLRERFLRFFENKGHTILPSAPLVPQGDAGLLLINAGMAPLKKYFLGLETPPNTRVTSCQKCIRTPDIDVVGKTARHGTYFEMLGNFSFGDYFKQEATAWAWEFITQELKMPVDKLWVSIYEEDDQAFDIWTKEVGVSPDRIVRLGKADNFWEIGSGPCGPCSEIYFDRGEKYGCGSPDCAVGCECDRFVEFWNIVFTQFNSDGAGTYTPLEHPNIDTGMGLERLACIFQGVDNLFEIDTMQNIMKHICEIAGITYKEDPKKDVSLRIITDHIRSTTFMIGDGVAPQNEGRGYVLRRLLRRAARHGRLLGIHEPFLYRVCQTVMEENEEAYPDLLANKEYIVKVIQMEEERFSKTIDQGMELLYGFIDALDSKGLKEEKVLSGDVTFKLYDTFGFPLELTKEILEERSIRINEDEFVELMNAQRKRARDARAAQGDHGWDGDVLAGKNLSCTFTGYDTLEQSGVVTALVQEGEMVESVGEGDTATLVLDQTSFYAESGGQIGDMGTIVSPHGVFRVHTCKKSSTGLYLHMGEMVSGVFTVGDAVEAKVSSPARHAIIRNHTACHLLQQALREVLGEHVHQSGSLVDLQGCRFDFSHFDAVTPEQLDRVEYLVNDMILSALPVSVTPMPIAEAKEMGAMALFGEKYGDVVRVCNAGGRSVELCGGVHVDNTSKIGLFKIVKESSVAAGIRRIEAVTGRGVLRLMDSNHRTMLQVAESMKAGSVSELPLKAAAVMAELKEKEKELDSLNQKMADLQMNNLFDGAEEIGSLKFISATFTGMKAEGLRTMTDKIKALAPKTIGVLVSISEGKATIAAAAGKEAMEKGVHCGKLIKELTALLGGSGGGRPDSAMGGTTEIYKVDEAIAQAPQIIAKMIGLEA